MTVIIYLILFIIAAVIISMLFNAVSFLFASFTAFLTSVYFILFLAFQLAQAIIPRRLRLVYLLCTLLMDFLAYCFGSYLILPFLINIVWVGMFSMSNLKTNFSERIRCWKELFSFRYQPPYEEKIILAGRRGEKFLKQYIASHEKFKNSYFFTSKRLENIEGKGRREIDMIVVTDRKIYVIECKNWSGDLYISGDNWIHGNKINKEQTVTTTYDDTTNPVNLNRTKSELLQRTLMANGFFINQEDIISKVILINKNLRVHGETDTIDDLILFKDLHPYLSQQDTKVENTLAEKLILSILSLCLDEKHFPIIADGISPCLGGERRKAMIDFLQNLPSWDYLYLTTNAIPDTKISESMPLKVVQGDLLYWLDISIHPVRINYTEIKSVTVKKHKEKLFSLLLTLIGLYPLVLHITMKDGSTRKVCGNPDGAVLFHEAGQKEPVKYSLMALGTIEIQSK